MTSTQWTAEQLLSFIRTPESVPFNPRPPGVIRPGSASDVVLAYLQRRGRVWASCWQIVAGTGRTPKAVRWTLIYLQHTVRIESEPDIGRSARYLRYRALVPAAVAGNDVVDGVRAEGDQ